MEFPLVECLKVNSNSLLIKLSNMSAASLTVANVISLIPPKRVQLTYSKR